MKFVFNKILQNIFLSVLICMIAFIISLLIFITEPQQRLQNSIYDSFFKIKTRIFKKDSKKTSSIIVVPIDDNALKRMEEKGIYWPWSRRYYGAIASYLIKEGARAVVFDIIFSNPDINRMDMDGGIEYGIDNDSYFKKVISDTGRVIISFSIDNNIKDNLSIDTLDIENAKDFKNIKEYQSILPPYSLFTEDNKNFGFVEIEKGSDGVIREYCPFVKIRNKYYPSLAAATYVLLNNKKLPADLSIDKSGQFKINWYGESGIDKTFKYTSILDIFTEISKKARDESKNISNNKYKDKIIFIGATARGLLDMKVGPLSSKEVLPGVEIHATAYLNLVNKDWIKVMPSNIEFAIYILMIFFLIYFGIDSKSPVRYSIIFIITLIILITIHFILLAKYNLICQTSFLAIFMLIGFLITLITNYVTVGRNRNRIKNAFSTYISPDLLSKVTTSDKPLTANGETIIASALFIDIAGFTTFSEKNNVEKVVEILNLYLKKFSEVIINNRGWINKYLGDGLMALFGAPTNFDDHNRMAVKSAFDCFKINKELSKDYGLNVRIGVNSGKMIFGSFGGGKKLEFTAIGDSINSTSRLEGANKFFVTNILVGESSKDSLNDEYDLNYLGKFSLKGKDIPTAIYYFNEAKKEYKEKFKDMIKAYESNNLDEFKGLVQYFEKTDFGPALFYINYFKVHSDKFGKSIKLTEK